MNLCKINRMYYGPRRRKSNTLSIGWKINGKSSNLLKFKIHTTIKLKKMFSENPFLGSRNAPIFTYDTSKDKSLKLVLTSKLLLKF